MATTFDQVTLVENDSPKGVGKLSVTESSVNWGDSLTLSYQSIILHALCTDTESYPKPCIYMQVEDGTDDLIEYRLVPSALTDLERIFKELSRCAALNPDEDDDEVNEDDSEMFDASTNLAKLQKLESVFVEPPGSPPPAVPGQFEEVDDESDGGD